MSKDIIDMFIRDSKERFGEIRDYLGSHFKMNDVLGKGTYGALNSFSDNFGMYALSPERVQYPHPNKIQTSTVLLGWDLIKDAVYGLDNVIQLELPLVREQDFPLHECTLRVNTLLGCVITIRPRIYSSEFLLEQSVKHIGSLDFEGDTMVFDNMSKLTVALNRLKRISLNLDLLSRNPGRRHE